MPDDASAPPRLRLVRGLATVAALLVVGALVVAQRAGLWQDLSDPARAARLLADAGAWGYVAFIAAYAIFQPFGVPGTLFILVAPILWPWPVAFGVSMTGTMAASVVGFSFSRVVARDQVRAWIPAKFLRYDDALERRGFATVVALRFVFWMPPLLHAFFGVSRVPFWTHFWGSFVGYLIPIFLVSFFGQRVFDALRAMPLETWVTLGGLAIGIALSVWLARRRVASNP